MDNNLKSYYRDLFEKHGNSPKAVQHSSKEDQFKRFKILSEHFKTKDSILDLGCGLGDFLIFLRANGFTGRYTGIDFVQEFVNHNVKAFANDTNASFIVLDIHQDELPKGFDHTTLSGVFNNIVRDNISFMETVVRKMFDAASTSANFNMMSTYVEYQSAELFYYDPLKVFHFCKTQLTPLVTLRHDYTLGRRSFPFEFAVTLRKI